MMGAGGTIRGTITVDGFPKDQATFNRVSGYVEQVSPSICYYHYCTLTSKGYYWCMPLVYATCVSMKRAILEVNVKLHYSQGHLSGETMSRQNGEPCDEPSPGYTLGPEYIHLLAQFDIHSPANTVLEALDFSAELRLEGVDAQQRKAFVDEVRGHHSPHCY